VVRLALVVELTGSGHQGRVPLPLRPIHGLMLGIEGSKGTMGAIFDYIVEDWALPSQVHWPRLDINVPHVISSPSCAVLSLLIHPTEAAARNVRKLTSRVCGYQHELHHPADVLGHRPRLSNCRSLAIMERTARAVFKRRPT
jgi:hypothetical protein